MTHVRHVVSLMILSTLLPAPVQAANEFFLLTEPAVKGDALDVNHRDQINVLGWSWGISNPYTLGTTGGGGGTGKAAVQDVTIIKWVDPATTTFIEYALKGQYFSNVTLFVHLPSTGKDHIDTYKLEMQNVFVTSIRPGGIGSDDRLTEQITLAFSKFTVTTVALKADGTPDAPRSTCWDLSMNAGC